MAEIKTVKENNKSKEKRSGRDLLMESRKYAKEDKTKSWLYTLSTLFLSMVAFGGTFLPFHWSFRLLSAILFGLLIVRSFIIYHDYLHGAILEKSLLGKILMSLFGIFVLAPTNIWKRSHDHHHNNNSKLSNSGIGSYPLVSKKKFMTFSKSQKFVYLAARHPLTIAFGYITLFILDFNVKSFIKSPKNHWDSLVALIIHVFVGYLIYTYFGFTGLVISWTTPFLIANGLGSLLFFVQHNFPEAKFRLNKDWSYFDAALESTSFLKMNAVMNWFTGNIGYHHVHHVNHNIPFYRLKETMANIEELQQPKTIKLNFKDISACLKLKVWDFQKQKMVGLK